MIERALAQPQGRLQGGDHLGAAGMAGEAIDPVARHAKALQDAVDGNADMLCREGWDGAVEDDAQPGRVDLPAHDVEAVGPQMLAGAFDAGHPRLAGAHDAGGSTIAEQCRRHHVGAGELVHAEGRGADLDRHHQHRRARPRARQAAGDGQPRDAAGTAQAEHRHALDIGPKAHPAGDPRFEAGRGDTSRRNGDDRIDVARLAPRHGQRARRGCDEQVLRALEIGGIALGPAEIGEVPVERLHGMAGADAGGFEDRRHPIEGGVAMTEHAPGRRGGIGLQQAVRRHGQADRNQRRGLVGIDRHRFPC